LSRLRAALPLILLLLAGVLMFVSGAFDRTEQLVAHQHELRARIADHPWMWRLAYVGLLTLVTSTGIPGTIVVILAGGVAFGTIDGTACSSIGLTLGSLILYLASRYAFGAGSKHPPKMVEKLHHGFESHPVSYTLFLRFVPVVAWLRCSLWLFLAATWVGGTTMLWFETSIGAGLGDAMSRSSTFGFDLFMHREVMLPLAAIAVLALLPLLIERLTRRFRQAIKHVD